MTRRKKRTRNLLRGINKSRKSTSRRRRRSTSRRRRKSTSRRRRKGKMEPEPEPGGSPLTPRGFFGDEDTYTLTFINNGLEDKYIRQGYIDKRFSPPKTGAHNAGFIMAEVEPTFPNSCPALGGSVTFRAKSGDIFYVKKYNSWSDTEGSRAPNYIMADNDVRVEIATVSEKEEAQEPGAAKKKMDEKVKKMDKLEKEQGQEMRAESDKKAYASDELMALNMDKDILVERLREVGLPEVKKDIKGKIDEIVERIKVLQCAQKGHGKPVQMKYMAFGNPSDYYKCSECGAHMGGSVEGWGK